MSKHEGEPQPENKSGELGESRENLREGYKFWLVYDKDYNMLGTITDEEAKAGKHHDGECHWEPCRVGSEDEVESFIKLKEEENKLVENFRKEKSVVAWEELKKVQDKLNKMEGPFLGGIDDMGEEE